MNLIDHIARQRAFSLRTFGPAKRTAGIIDHIVKELDEIKAVEGKDLDEWIDVIILAIDGAHRMGFTPHEIAYALEAKQLKNEARDWPDWRTVPEDKAIEHVRDLPPKSESIWDAANPAPFIVTTVEEADVISAEAFEDLAAELAHDEFTKS